jgi:hypothetical protein
LIRISKSIVVLVLAAGCSSKSTDGDADTVTIDTVDTVSDGVDADDPGTDPGDDTVEDTGDDLGEDPGADTGDDPGDDPGEDPGGDPGEDPGGDSGLDPATDPAVDVVDDDGAAGCSPLDVTGGATDAWAICFMGVGTHAIFTLDYDNTLDCDITSVEVTGGSLNLASDDSVIFTFGPLTPSGTFSGTVAGATSASVDYHASDGMDGAGYDGQSVYVEASVTWDGGSTTVKSANGTLTCVY